MGSIGTFQRRLEDILNDFTRTRSTWKDINEEGFSVANKLVNAAIQSKYTDDNAYWHPALCQEFPDILQAFDSKMATIIDAHFDKLVVIVDRMEKQYRKMENFVQELNALCERANALCGSNFVDATPLFKTCPLVVYVRRINGIVSMYSRELATQKSLPLGFRQIGTREESLGLLSAWLNQPSLDCHAIKEFEDLCRVELSKS